MFVSIGNTPRPYAWGSRTAIAELLGRTPSGEPEAELWFGAHPGSPSRILEPSRVGGWEHLDEWIRADPVTTLGDARRNGPSPASAGPGDPDRKVQEPRLPFLLKLLAADQPLSLQVHPTPEQARAGHLRQERAGIAPDDPARDYKDPYAKPEMLVALSRFDALCGFRPVAESRAFFESLATEVDPAPGQRQLAAFARRLTPPSGPEISLRASRERDEEARRTREGERRALAAAVSWLLGSEQSAPLIDAVTASAAREAAREAGAADNAPDDASWWRLVGDLSRRHPGDPGIVLALLMNRVRLEPGDALYLPAGTIHAYLHGLGIELMTASDNVLRGGLTRKHVNVPELLRILDCMPAPAVVFTGTPQAPGVDAYQPCSDFTLVSIRTAEGEAVVPLAGAPAILLCMAGMLKAEGTAGSVELHRGDCVYVTPEEGTVTVTGAGWAVLATSAGVGTVSSDTAAPRSDVQGSDMQAGHTRRS